MSEEKKTIGIFLDRFNRITGGHKRRVNMANELTKRGYDVSILVKVPGKIHPRWKGLEIPKIEKTGRKVEKDFVFIGDTKYQLGPWLASNGKRVWMFQGITTRRNEKLDRMWKDKNIVLLTFSSWMKKKIEKLFNREAILAPGAVDPKFYCPSNQPREKILLSTKVHLKYADHKEIGRILDQHRWRLEFLFGNELDVLRQYQRAGLCISLRGDKEGSVWRDWNNPIAEAMACAVPTIVLKSGGTGDIAFHKETAYVLEDREKKTVVEGIDWMIREEEERMKIGEKGYKHIQNFSYEKMIDIIVKEILEK